MTIPLSDDCECELIQGYGLDGICLSCYNNRKKEFIRRLKEDFYKESKAVDGEYGLFVSVKRFEEIIKKRAGDFE